MSHRGSLITISIQRGILKKSLENKKGRKKTSDRSQLRLDWDWLDIELNNLAINLYWQFSMLSNFPHLLPLKAWKHLVSLGYNASKISNTISYFSSSFASRNSFEIEINFEICD